MSPEHARGEAVDARADVFAAGIVLWELLAGRRMYKAGDGVASPLEQARRANVPVLPHLGLPAEEELRAVLAKALSVDRDSRYPSAPAMLRDLDDYVARAKLRASALQLGEWLATTFGAEIISRRRARERAMSALERGVPLVAEPIAPIQPAPPSPEAKIAKRRSPALVVVAAVVVALAGFLLALAMR